MTLKQFPVNLLKFPNVINCIRFKTNRPAEDIRKEIDNLFKTSREDSDRILKQTKIFSKTISNPVRNFQRKFFEMAKNRRN